jgi:hypothetical protein
VSGLSLSYVNWTAQSTAGTVLSLKAGHNPYKLAALVLNSSDGNEVTLTDTAGNVLAATKDTLGMYYDRYGPCMTSLALAGTGHVSVGWYETP